MMEKGDEESDKDKGNGSMNGSASISERLAELNGNMDEINRVKRKYPMKITRYYFDLIKGKDDPIWKQAVPAVEEVEDDFNQEDPLQEEEHTPVPYLVHKYPDRVLLLISSMCAMYCRFCTRKRKVGRIQQIPLEDVYKAIDYIKEHKEVRDVVVSGGDPLMRADNEIEEVLKRLREIPHLDIIRIGTRMPCVQPARITPHLVNILKKYHPLFMNIHFNHPNEITPESSAALKLLADAGIPLGSQTVLLKGVNDNPQVMMELMHKLIRNRVKPYYIYQCDLVKGVDHFRTSVETGIEIMRSLQGFTSGLCLPHFVIDGPGGKVPISPQYVKDITPDQIIITNFMNNLYSYPGIKKGEDRQLFNKHVRRIGIAFNLKKTLDKNDRFDKYAEFDDLDTINGIRVALERAGYEVVLLEADKDFIYSLKDSNIDFVFNIAEGIHGESRESHVPAILEMFNIPYSGSGVLTQAITLNKSRKKEILDYYHINTPRWQVFKNTNQKLDPNLRFPLMVKPDAEGSSVGITNDSLVNDLPALKKQVSKILKDYDQPALVEEFLTGREFTVSLLGNPPRVMPIVEVNFDHLPANIHRFDSWEAKWIFDNPNSPVDPIICPADLKPKLKAQIEKVAKQTFEKLGCVDLARIDIRLDNEGNPHVLDVNALPGLMPDPKMNSRFPRSCFAAGMTYDQIILTILNSALKRYNLLLDPVKERTRQKVEENGRPAREPTHAGVVEPLKGEPPQVPMP
jgi:lysine 2,3-aminomutase